MISNSIQRPLLGAHMSIAGGVQNAVIQGKSIGCEAIQIFTKPSRQWSAKPYTEEEIKSFKERLKESSIQIVIAHDSYLLNLGSHKDELRKKSVEGLVDELNRCESLGIPCLIAHPGSHNDTGEEAGIKRIAQSIDEAHQSTGGFKAQVTLEITAGQGSNLGYKFEQIKSIIDLTKEPERIKVCFDTEHAFASGYDIRTQEGYDRTFSEFDEIIGLDNLAAFHMNDSKKELGSRVDRHEHIGQGMIGTDAFKFLVNDKRFWGLPMCLETPKSEDLKEDIINLNLLRSLMQKDQS